MKTALVFALISGLAPVHLASAKPNRAAEIVTAVQMCNVDTTSAQSIAALKSAGWRDITPVMFGKSMAEVAGGAEFSRGKDKALVNAANGAIGQNCQFDFAVSDASVVSQVEAALTQVYGSPDVGQTDNKRWSRNGNSYSLVTRSAGKLTVLWLPQKTQKVPT